MAQRLSRKQAAQLMEVDSTRLAGWERGEQAPEGEFAVRVLRFLTSRAVN
jgi:DNA-binding transcriptional regulator YiaG